MHKKDTPDFSRFNLNGNCSSRSIGEVGETSVVDFCSPEFCLVALPLVSPDSSLVSILGVLWHINQHLSHSPCLSAFWAHPLVVTVINLFPINQLIDCPPVKRNSAVGSLKFDPITVSGYTWWSWINTFWVELNKEKTYNEPLDQYKFRLALHKMCGALYQ